MRFVRLKTVVTKLCDMQISNKPDVVTILSKIKEKELTCSVRLSSGPMYYDVRILEMNDESIRWRTTKNQSSLVKWSKIDEVEYLEVNVKSEVLANLKPNPSRWSILDSGDNEDPDNT